MSKQLPLYHCHKQVHALKILAITRSDRSTGKFTLQFTEAGYDAIEIDGEMTARYMPKTGDYYVIYADGYASFSPAKVFEQGYTRIEG